MVYSTWIPGSKASAPPVPTRLTNLPWSQTEARLPPGATVKPLTRLPPMTDAHRQAVRASAFSPQPNFEDTACSERLRTLMCKPSSKNVPIVRSRPPGAALSCLDLSSPSKAERLLRPSPSPPPMVVAETAATSLKRKFLTPQPKRSSLLLPGDLDHARIELTTPAVKRHFHAGPASFRREGHTQRESGGSRDGTPPAAPSDVALRPPQKSTPQLHHSPARVSVAGAKVAGWPVRHLPVESGVAGASVESVTLRGADCLTYTCPCKRPVGDVALCSHSQHHLRFRRWSEALQRVMNEEHAAWGIICVAARDAALARWSLEQSRKATAAAAAPPPVHFAAGSFSALASVAAVVAGGHSRRRSSTFAPHAEHEDHAPPSGLASPSAGRRHDGSRSSSDVRGVHDQLAPVPSFHTVQRPKVLSPSHHHGDEVLKRSGSQAALTHGTTWAVL
jgi:hypothetical protein